MTSSTKTPSLSREFSSLGALPTCESRGRPVPGKEKLSYSEKLKDTRWQKRRLKIFDAARWTCEECGVSNPTNGLQVHHIIYLAGVEPWDHPNEVMMCLCAGCHEKRQEFERQFYTKIAQVIRHKSVEELKDAPVWWMFETKPFYPKDKE